MLATGTDSLQDMVRSANISLHSREHTGFLYEKEE